MEFYHSIIKICWIILIWLHQRRLVLLSNGHTHTDIKGGETSFRMPIIIFNFNIRILYCAAINICVWKAELYVCLMIMIMLMKTRAILDNRGLIVKFYSYWLFQSQKTENKKHKYYAKLLIIDSRIRLGDTIRTRR